MPLKKYTKPKLLTEEFEDFINENNYIKDNPKNKKATKRSQSESETKEIDKIPMSERNIKKQKDNIYEQNDKEITGKLVEVMDSQLKTRKQCNETLLSSLSDVMNEIKEDCMIFKSNQEMLLKLAGAFMKCVSQATTAEERKLTTLKEICASFKEKCEKLETENKCQASKLANELEEDIKKLHQKLIAETRRASLENLQKTIFQSMQTEFEQ